MIEVSKQDRVGFGDLRDMSTELYATIQAIYVELDASGESSNLCGAPGHVVVENVVRLGRNAICRSLFSTLVT